MADPYPLPDLPVSMVGDVAGQFKQEFNGKRPVWIVPQAFGGGELWESGAYYTGNQIDDMAIDNKRSYRNSILCPAGT